ncbi:MAG: hypothetical protein KF835_09685 [Xanthobacteraceae bacterium]|jgi:hypothetical protein|nr:hypothetical protein [Xanthobacteraceae bacterium]
MNYKTCVAAAALLFAISGSALAQSKIPSISSLWDETRLSQRECNSRAEDAMRRTGFTRIETIGQTTFGDRTDYQVGFRCVADKGIYYIFGGGPDEPVVRRYIDELKSTFNR